MRLITEIPSCRKGHAHDPALGGGIGDLADLPFEGGDRRRVDDDAPLVVLVGGVVRHSIRLQPQQVEGADQVQFDDSAELVEWMGPIANPSSE